ncbi:MAG TPA: tRNA pseudouridine(55) synthase TruB [Desulfomonilaceae bacterium]|nr:tRNA pseudouridine(55) synthase TruB [Desulfomonilaceae bacterium]
MHGILLVDKPEGVTSNEVVRLVKAQVKPAKVGHSGTLDPAASGLMVILVGAGTRTLDYLDENRKCYHMIIRLGEETDTADREGRVISTTDASGIGTEQIEVVLRDHTGVLDQIPPHFSAIKKGGVPLYKLARKGIFPDLAPRKVEIFSLMLKKWEHPFLELVMTCSRGTYARALARDVGRDLNVGGRLESLRRTESGRFVLDDSVHMDEIGQGGAGFIRDHLMGIPEALTHISDFQALPGEVRKLMRGSHVILPRSRFAATGTVPDEIPRLYKIVSGKGGLVILVRPEPRGAELAIRPIKVFNTWQEE